MRTPGRVAATNRALASVYLTRGEQLLEAMEHSREKRLLESVASNGVQAAVAFADAYTVFRLQQRSRGQDHGEVVQLIRRCPGPESADLAALIQGVLNQKSEVQYGERLVRPKDAAQLAEAVREIAGRVKAALGPARQA
jgi:hypothetical protein